mmetsp:Transcript_74750/g.206168  ORF Transcript_74750/g.206168 Transcript_74750/m.206168 type:complete len:161 (+) Transcript_74750:82-564(+)
MKGRGSAHYILVLGPPGVISFTEPIPREDGVFVAGPRTFKFTANLWGINGMTGELKPILSGDNAAMKQRIAEYVKNILRGRVPWGLKVRLSGAFALLSLSDRPSPGRFLFWCSLTPSLPFALRPGARLALVFIHRHTPGHRDSPGPAVPHQVLAAPFLPW